MRESCINSGVLLGPRAAVAADKPSIFAAVYNPGAVGRICASLALRALVGNLPEAWEEEDDPLDRTGASEGMVNARSGEVPREELDEGLGEPIL